MKFTDILSLAKQGYTPQDIKDLLALSTDQDTDKEAEQKDPENRRIMLTQNLFRNLKKTNPLKILIIKSFMKKNSKRRLNFKSWFYPLI